jgi:hypothetical protein
MKVSRWERCLASSAHVCWPPAARVRRGIDPRDALPDHVHDRFATARRDGPRRLGSAGGTTQLDDFFRKAEA